MKNTGSIYLVAVICFLALYACGSRATEKKFIDLPAYFRAEKDSIPTKHTTVLKTTVYRGDTSVERVSTRDMNWDKEFALFIKTDVNKPLYLANMHRLDWPIAVREPAGTERHGYSILANTKILDIQSIDIGTSKKGIVSVSILLHKSNLLSETNIRASYFKDSMYVLSGDQEMKGLGSGNTFMVSGRFEDQP